MTAERSRVIRRTAEGWAGIVRRAYKNDHDSFRGVDRHTLAAPAGSAFELRYFELARDGYSSFEHHAHEHVVVCLIGQGRVRLRSETHDLSPGDVVVVATGDPHQFLNTGDEPFGFLCIVDQDRDRPTPLRGE